MPNQSNRLLVWSSLQYLLGCLGRSPTRYRSFDATDCRCCRRVRNDCCGVLHVPFVFKQTERIQKKCRYDEETNKCSIWNGRFESGAWTWQWTRRNHLRFRVMKVQKAVGSIFKIYTVRLKIVPCKSQKLFRMFCYFSHFPCRVHPMKSIPKYESWFMIDRKVWT